jgi:uncharacterized protein (DUF2225 family)
MYIKKLNGRFYLIMTDPKGPDCHYGAISSDYRTVKIVFNNIRKAIIQGTYTEYSYYRTCWRTLEQLIEIVGSRRGPNL